MADIEVSYDLQNKKDINASFSDVIDINLQKEIKMGIELNAPLYIGADTNLQKQVTQNTADIADLKQDVSDIETDIGNLNDLDTVDKSSVVNAINEALSVLDPTQTADYINNSKGLKSGEVSTNSIILNDIKEMSHSTFDLSKFTVVGSPNITDDGIASGFSRSNALTITPFSSIITIPERITFHSKGTYSSNANTANSIQTMFTTDISGIRPGVNPDGRLTCSDNSGGGSVRNHYSSSPVVQNNDTVEFDVSIKANEYTVQGRVNGILRWNETFSGTYDFSQLSDAQAEISVLNNYYWTGSIDLKQFSITVDGVPVFSGNKTGIDTIKPDDYDYYTRIYAFSDGSHTIYADASSSPTKLFNSDGSNYTDSDFTISEGVVYYGETVCSYTSGSNINLNTMCDAAVKITDDGIMSGASTYRRLGKSIDVSYDITNHEYKVECKVIYDNSYMLFQCGQVWCYYDSSASKLYIVGAKTGGGNATFMQKSMSLNNGDVLDITVTFKQGKQTLKCVVNNTTTYTETSSSTSMLATTSTTTGIKIGSNGYSGMGNGSIDLNAFKIYVDGNLVYQPCLKIPYIESKTGSKIVNAIYRDRVNDMAEQFGYANYYTLDEDNGNFTLPQVELYGLIGQRTLRDSYRNGINYWELYSNRDLEQGGSCTSGVEVTFARPFADTNYVLSVPYSAKSTTAFTPTQTGDWIAKGKGLL